jgi:hypothetical protein
VHKVRFGRTRAIGTGADCCDAHRVNQSQRTQQAKVKIYISDFCVPFPLRFGDAPYEMHACPPLLVWLAASVSVYRMHVVLTTDFSYICL